MIFSPLSGTEGIEYHESQGFGANPARYAKYGLDGHNGFDLATPVGTPVYSPIDGYVHYADEGSVGYGKFVTITSLPMTKDGIGRKFELGHLSRFIAGLEGQFVHMGDLVGLSGSTGDSTGPHVHVTPKQCDALGNTINKDNGFHGALDEARYTQQWIHDHVLR